MLAKARNVEVINLQEMDAEVHANPHVDTAPFGVQRTSKTSQMASPYGRTEKEKMEARNTVRERTLGPQDGQTKTEHG